MFYGQIHLEHGSNCYGGNCRPSSFDQFWHWVEIFIPRIEKFHMAWDWPGFAGLFGEPEITYALKEKMWDLPQRWFALPYHLSLFGLNYNRKRTSCCWREARISSKQWLWVYTRMKLQLETSGWSCFSDGEEVKGSGKTEVSPSTAKSLGGKVLQA